MTHWRAKEQELDLLLMLGMTINTSVNNNNRLKISFASWTPLSQDLLESQKKKSVLNMKTAVFFCTYFW